ncbi:DUF397 domain-containing protein [Streptomyces sp. NPDC051018]|uniref:DUF397 domain-containing protein n=1 Tax=Streptomyces sp. NPDC051018 TaxID=3365639 RepID=UPI0037A44EE1
MTSQGTWFKSSYSGGTGNSCVEVAWFKSSYSGGTGNDSVEVVHLAPRVGIRDSKNKQGPALIVRSGAWAGFVAFAAGVSAP